MIEIAKYNPCQEALDYRVKHDSFEAAWKACRRGDWMLWIAARIGVDKRTLTLAKALCSKTVLHLMTDERSRKAVDVAEAYGRGSATEAELAAAYAAAAADAAYAAAADAAAAYAAAAAAYAAYAADAAAADAADAAHAAHAAYAADAAAYAADAAARAADARKSNRLATAEICREILTDAVLAKINTTKPIEP